MMAEPAEDLCVAAFKAALRINSAGAIPRSVADVSTTSQLPDHSHIIDLWVRNYMSPVIDLLIIIVYMLSVRFRSLSVMIAVLWREI